VLKEYTTEEQRSIVPFSWAKRLNSNDIYKVIYPVYRVKCLSRKVIHNWVQKSSKGFADDEEVETEVWKWHRQQ
jgi:hypothetical protein